MQVYQAIANEIDRINMNQNGANEALEDLINDFLPSGSGFDGQIFIDSKEEKFCHRFELTVSYHCMNDNGYYDGWIEVVYTITPSFDGYDIKENWKGYNGKYKELSRDYMGETLAYHLDMDVVSVWNIDEQRNYYTK